MDIGAHCSTPGCHQQDFLPFTCDCCSGVFCLAHRSYDAHECPRAGSKDRRVVQCPVCKQHIRWTSEQDVNAVWEQHVRVGQCTPEKLRQQQAPRQQPKKKRCAAQACRQVLLTSNQFHCAKCRQDVCLKHRFESDHACAAARQTQRQQWLGGFRPPASAKTTAKATTSTHLQQNAKQAATSVVSGAKSAVSSLVQTAKATASSSAEECPMCQKQFDYVSQLIVHVNRAHPDSSTTAPRPSASSTAPSGVSTATGREVCPQCRAVFPDLNALIRHAETAHSSAAVGAGGGTAGDQDKCMLM